MKMFQNVGVFRTIVVLGIFVVQCNARHGMDHGQWARDKHEDKSILCYECNSEYDPRCGDPFDPFTIGVVNCSKKRPLQHINVKPTLCRKTVQKVQGNLRVIRGCGYIQDTSKDGKECLIRTGTHDVHVRYCSCKSGNLCNTGNLQHRPSRIVLGAVLLGITRLALMG